MRKKLALTAATVLALFGAGLVFTRDSSAAHHAAHHKRLAVHVHLSLHARSRGTIVATASLKTAPRAVCGLTISVHRERAKLPPLRANKRGHAAWQWGIVSASPSGVWHFKVSCIHRGKRGHAGKRAAVITGSGSKKGPIGDPYSLSEPTGQIAGLGGAAPFERGECPWMAWEKRPDIYNYGVQHGIPAGGSRGTSQGRTVYWWDGMMWYLNAKKVGLSVGSTPKPNAIVSWGPWLGNPYGHVAYVAQVSSASRILIDQCNGFTLTCNQQWINPLTFVPGKLEGYVYGLPDRSPPSEPGGLHVSAQSTTYLSVAWNASSDNVGVSGYSLYLNGSHVSDTGSTSATLGGLSCGHTYTIGVNAYDAAGNRSATASVSASTSACPPPPPSGGDTTPPSTPTNLHLTGRSLTAVTVAWNPSTDNVGVAGYFVFENGTHVANETGTSALVGGLLCSHTYTIGVNAYDAAGNHSSTTSISVSTSACPTGKIIISPCLDFHNGPGAAYTLIGCIPDGTIINIYCTAQGNAVTGPYGTETIWDRTYYGGKWGYVTDAYVYTGTNSAIAPAC